MIQLQLLTAARSGELVILRPCEIDQTGKIWVYRPAQHKTAHRGFSRTIYFGPRAQEVLRPFLMRPKDAYCFSPAEAMAEWRQENFVNRRTPRHQGNTAGTNVRQRPSRTPGAHYKVTGYGHAVAKAVWSRAAESTRKLALLYACSENYQCPTITEAAVQWATDFVNHQIRRQLYMANLYAAENSFHAECLKLKEKLRNEPGQQMTHSKLLKRMKIDKDTFKKLIETLMEQGDIQIKKSESATFKGAVYVLCD